MSDQLELSILDSGARTRAIAVARCGVDMAIESFSGRELGKLFAFHADLSGAAGGRKKPPTALELAQFGRDLFALLVRGRIEKIYNRLPDSHVRLQIYSNRSDVQSVPWEYIQQPDGVPGPNAYRSVVRIVPTVGVPAPVARRLDKIVRMLFVYADPPTQPSVEWAPIKATIESKFKRHLPNNFALDVLEGANPATFMDAFNDFKYDILHIVCHGVIENGLGYLVFQDVQGKTQRKLSAVRLGTFLRNKELGLVVLSACYSSAGDFSKEFAVIAQTLVESGIPAVVANQFEIQMTAAAVFAKGFYSELLRSGDVDRATTEGRLSLDFGEDPPNNVARIDWGIPSLYRHLGGARVFTT